MVAPLLKTKLHIPPPRPDMVPRSRLHEQLNAGLHGKLILLSAPAGFGKTTLLSKWVTALLSSAAWLSLDEGDNDPARFWTYVITALQTVCDGVGVATLTMLASPRPPPIEPLLTDLINEVAEVRHPLILALDDYHLITAQPIHDSLTFLLEHMPAHMHLVIATRRDPPLPLARWRGRGQLRELRAADLRFTLDEAATFLNGVMGLDLSVEDIAALEVRTEGWIAGLQMAALSMRGQQDVRAFINALSGSHRFILDYLVEEVLDRQPDEVREFLLKTSILERMSGSLCDALLEIGDWRVEVEPSDSQSPISNAQSPPSTIRHPSQEMLEYLERANLFLIPLDEERHWYRYHHLFADLLRDRLAQTYPEEVSRLHQRASEWFEREGFIEETIAHAFAAPDNERVVRLIEKYGRGMLRRGKYNALASWLESLPDALVRQRPWLCVFESWTRHWTGTREGGEELLRNAEQVLDRSSLVSEAEKGILLGYVATVRAHYAIIKDEIPRALEQAQKALELLPEDDYFARGSATVALGGAYEGMGDVLSAERTFAECAANAAKDGYSYRAASAMCYMGVEQVKQARLYQAEEAFREALVLSQGPGGRRILYAGHPLVKLGELACEWNDLESAHRYVDEGMALCTQLGQVDWMAEAYVALARVQLARRDIAGVRDTLRREGRLLQMTNLDPWIACWVDDCQIRLWLMTGQLDEAIRWAQTSGLSVDDAFSYHHDLHHINLARVLVAWGIHQPSGPHLDDALRLLARLQDAAEAAGWVHTIINILVMRALALQARGDGDGALASLAEALALAEPSGYVRTFIDEGAPMGDLLRQALVRGIAVEYVSTLVAALDGECKPSPPSLVEPLSERELEVLRLLTTRLSSTEIGRELYISTNTVRTHIKHIYGKLGVHRRQEAIQRARELGLL